MEIDWRGKHNQWFKNWLEDMDYPQYWNTLCCNYNDDNYYFNNIAYDSTFNKCRQLIDNFVRCAKNWIEHIIEAGLNVEEEIAKKNTDRNKLNKRNK